MKLISLNLGLFEDNNSLLDDFFKDNPFDLGLFQEVCRPWEKSALDQLTTVSKVKKWFPHSKSFFGPVSQIRKFETNDFHGSESFSFDLGGLVDFGNLVMTKYPISFAKNSFVQNDYSFVTDFSNWPEEDYRAVQVVLVDLPSDKKLQLINYHGVWTQDKQGNQQAAKAVRQILKLSQEFNGPTIIAGDFNLFPDTSAIQPLNKAYQSLVDLYQIKTTRPKTNELHFKKRNVVDYIFVSPEIKIKSFAVLNTEISDHLPLVLEFEV